MKPTKRTTYLSRVESDYFSRKWYRRSVTLFCNLLFTGKWMRKTQITRCIIVEISEGGATVRIGKSEIPDNLYLVLGRFDVVVGSIVVQRDPGVSLPRVWRPLRNATRFRSLVVTMARGSSLAVPPASLSCILLLVRVRKQTLPLFSRIMTFRQVC